MINKKLLYDLYALEQIKLTKNQLFDKFSILTYKYYKKELKNIIKHFPNTHNEIPDWRNFVGQRNSNNGREVEDCLFHYLYHCARSLIVNQVNGKGKDMMIDNLIIEIKSSQKNVINTKLQSSFYKNSPNKFYIFVKNTSQNNIQFQIVSSQILYYYSLGSGIIDEIHQINNSLLLDKQIDLGLSNLDLKTFIKTSIMTGETCTDRKTFYIGNNDNVRVRFQIFIESK